MQPLSANQPCFVFHLRMLKLLLALNEAEISHVVQQSQLSGFVPIVVKLVDVIGACRH